MVVQVGDKVLVYGAGTPWAFAKKIEPVEVGDKVDVVTLSDGTKLAMPKIKLDLSEYVWVVPEFDTPFNIGDVPFQWGMMPLGAAVFTLGEVLDCNRVSDIYREWEAADLAKCVFMPITGQKKGVQYTIVAFANGIYTLAIRRDDWTDLNWATWANTTPTNDPMITPLSYTVDPWLKICNIGGSQYLHRVVQLSLNNANLNGAAYLQIPHVGVTRGGDSWFQITCGAKSVKFGGTGGGMLLETISAQICSQGFTSLEVSHNANWPGYDTYSLPIIGTSKINLKFYAIVNATWVGGNPRVLQVDIPKLVPITPDCQTYGLAAGDKYVIYNTVTKRLVFNDATKFLTAANWQTGGEGAEISSSPVEYVWDGQGYVYLTSSKTTFSTIQFDDLLQVQAVHGETARTIAYHLGERIEVSGETVSRELTNITSILRAGKNTITLTAKNQDGTKVGFVTAVYVKRNMTAVSL